MAKDKMLVLNIKDSLNINHVPDNDSTWYEIKAVVDNVTSGGGSVVLDFKGVHLNEPYSNVDFNKMIRNENVSMRVYNYSKLVSRIDMICRLANVSMGRVENIGVVLEAKRKPDSYTDVNPRLVSVIKKIIYEDGGILYIPYANALQGIERESTLNSLDQAIIDSIESSEVQINSVVLDLTNTRIQSNVMDSMIEMIDRYKKDIEFKMINAINMREFEMKVAVEKGFKKNMPDSDKYEIMAGELKDNTVGLLSMYNNKRSNVDQFGRLGNGNIVWTRYAILLYMDELSYTATFRVFSNHTFHTSIHKAIENMGDVGLNDDIIEVKMSEIGFFDYFLGSGFHFNYPMQYDKENSERLWLEVEEGLADKVELTIPERAKVVLDEYEIEYDKEGLENAIRQTRSIIGC